MTLGLTTDQLQEQFKEQLVLQTLPGSLSLFSDLFSAQSKPVGSLDELQLKTRASFVALLAIIDANNHQLEIQFHQKGILF
jgi:hypothetical protein